MTERKHPLAECEKCPYYSQTFVPSELRSASEALYTVVGESPGSDEARTGKPFTGPSGDLLWHTGITRSGCSIINVIACVPPSTKEKSFYGGRGEYDQLQKSEMQNAARIADDKAQAAAACRVRFEEELRSSTKRVLLLGRIAQAAVVPELEGSENTQVGRWLEAQDGADALYTHHPAYILRAPAEARTFFRSVQKFIKVPPGPKLPPPPIAEVVTSSAQMEWLVNNWTSWMRDTHERLQICIDLECDQIDWQHDAILCMGIYDGYYEGCWVVPRAAFDAVLHGDAGWINALDHFFQMDVEWILQNGKFDMRFLRGQYRFEDAKVTWDTMLAHYALDERKGTHDLKGLCAWYFDVDDWELTMANWIGTKKQHNVKYSIIPEDVLHRYVAQDVYYDWNLKQVLERDLKKEGLLEWPFLNLLMPMNEMLLGAELYGTKVDIDLAERLASDYEDKLRDVSDETVLFTKGQVWNPGSPPQVSKFVYEHLKLQMPSGLAKKPGCVDDEVIEQLEAYMEDTGQTDTDAYKFLTLVRKYRRVHKLLTSYIRPILTKHTNELGRVHPEFIIPGTETGRISARNPAIQTIPRPNDRDIGVEGQKLRSLFITEPGRMLVNVDYSQAELRMAAQLSGDSFLINAYRTGRDIHSEVTTRVFGEHFTDEQRQRIKVLNFRFLNGGNMRKGLYARGESIPQAVANELAKNYADTMRDLIAYSRDMEKLLHKQHYVQSIFGRKRRMPLINDRNKEEARKVAINQPISGAASDLCMLSAIALTKTDEYKKWDAHILLTLHDSILIDVPDEHAEEIGKLCQRLMVETGVTYASKVPWKADVKMGRTWK